jgi:hypothetical protein
MAKGGFTGAVPPRETSPEDYSGVWDITEQYGEQKAGSWPFQADDCAPRSLRFNSADSANLSKTLAAAGNRKTWTMSYWVKRAKLNTEQMVFSAASSSSHRVHFYYESNNNIAVYSPSFYYTTNVIARDPGAWQHLVFACDTTQSTDTDRFKIYINSVLVTSFANQSHPAQNLDTPVSNNILHQFGGRGYTSSSYADVYLADIHFIDGQALSPQEFGFFDGQGIWQPKRFTGDYSNGPVYSNGTLSASQAQGNIANLFDGNIRPQHSASGSYGNQFYIYNQSAITYTFPQPLSGTFKVYAGNGDWNGSSSNSGGTISLNTGASVTLPTPGTQFYYATVGVGTNVTSITFNPANGGILMGAIYVDDVQLIDASVGRNSFHLDFADSSSNEALGYDSSGVGNDWTVNNITASVPIISGVSFDGSGDRLKVADSADLAFGTGEFTVEMYFICDTVSGNDVLYDSRAATGNTSDGFSIVRNGNLLRTYTSGSYKVTSSTTLSTGQLYHLAVTREGTTQKMYLDGTLVGSTTVSNDFSQQKATIGSDVNGSESWDGFISNVRLVKGTAVYTGNFTAPTGDLTNVTNTVLLCCQSSTSVTEATVSPGTITAYGNVFVTQTPGAEGIDSLLDTPVNGNEASTGAGGERRGNYATLNPLASDSPLLNGNLESDGASGAWKFGIGTIPFPKSGKWYFEVQATAYSGNFGIAKLLSSSQINATIRDSSESTAVWYAFDGKVWSRYSGQGSTTGVQAGLTTFNNGDIVGFGVNVDDEEVKFYVNGSLQYTYSLPTQIAADLTAGRLFPIVDTYGGVNAICNFGQRPFAYPLSGFSPLATSFLPEPTIKRGDEAMDVVTYTGDGSSTRTISSYRFSPGLAWI